MIALWRDDKGFGDDWFLSSISIKQSNVDVPFPVHRWILPHRVYEFAKYDSVLPQLDERKDQRIAELT